MGTCPKCDALVHRVKIADADIVATTGARWRGIKYCCVSCGAVLSVGIDPVALKTDTVNEILRALRKH